MKPHRLSTGWMLGACVSAVVLSATTSAQPPTPVLLVVTRPADAPATLVMIDVASEKILGRVAIGSDPHEVAASDDGKLAFVANTNSHDTGVPDGDSISVVDVLQHKEIHRVPVGQGTEPHGIVFVGDKVFYTADGWQAIGCFDPVTNKIAWMLGTGQVGSHMIAVSKDMKSLFVTNNGSGTVSAATLGQQDNVNYGANAAMSAPPAWRITVIPAGKSTESVVVSPDGTEAWAANKNPGGGGVTIIDVATRTVKQTLDFQTKHANRMRITSDGKYVLLLDREANELLIIDAAARKVARRITLNESGDNTQHASVGDLIVAGDNAHAYVTVNVGGRADRYDEQGHVNRASAGDRSGMGNRAYVAEVDLETLAVSRRIPTDPGADGVAWAAVK